MARISQRELEASIFQPGKQDRKVVDLSATPDTTYYTIFGKHIELDENDNPVIFEEKKAYAKQVRRGSTYSYYVKVGNSGHLHDPLGMYATREESKLSQSRGKPEVRFVKTNQKVFDFYVRYLRTKNKAYLSHATREM